MGYYTRFDISENLPTVQEAIQEASDYGNWYEGQIEAKWYKWEAHCRKVSEDFPNLVIVVEGHGEEQGDDWRAYFKQGKMQQAKATVTYESFDESKLK